MNKKICWTAFFIGLFAVGWVGVGYIGGSPLALAMTVIIGLVYMAGAAELRRAVLAGSTRLPPLKALIVSQLTGRRPAWPTVAP